MSIYYLKKKEKKLISIILDMKEHLHKSENYLLFKFAC